MPTDAAATAAFKANPVNFLASAMILAPDGNALSRNRSEHLGLIPAPRPVNALRASDHATIPVWQVVKARPFEPYFRACIANRARGNTAYTTLDGNDIAEFCFPSATAGSTVGLSTPAPDGTMLVSNTPGNQGFDYQSISDSMGQHTGAVEASQRSFSQMMEPQDPRDRFNLDWSTIQDSLSSQMGGGMAPMGALEGYVPGAGQVTAPQNQVAAPKTSLPGQRRALTFGHRPGGTGAWTFYLVTYTATASVIVNFGVKPMPANSVTA